MIVIKLQGGLGNQLFQYAFGLSISRRLGRQFVLDTSLLNIDRRGVTPRSYELYPYNISAGVPSFEALSKCGVVRSPYLLKLLRRLDCSFFRCKYFYENGFEFTDITEMDDNLCLVFDGYWQSEEFFSSVKDELRMQISSFRSSSSFANSLLDEIGKSNSVAVHVRRGDYISNTSAAKFHSLCGVDYYNAAIKYFEQNFVEPHFFVFTDDPNWAETNISTTGSVTMVSGTGLLTHHDELSLMGSCRHNIIANSSFSWWGAWLNSNSGKHIIAPKQWHRNKMTPNNLLPAEWLRI